MYLSGRKVPRFDFENNVASRTEDGFDVGHVELRLAYWRKHADLHGYIVDTFAEGKDECQEIELDAADLRQIIAAVKEGLLPETDGFFFRYSGYSPAEFAAEDVKKLEAALEWLNAKPEKEYRYLIYAASW
jgi:hypothetical protein